MKNNNYKKIKRHKCFCGLCRKLADCNWWYNAPGDIDSDNLAPLIHLCEEHKEKYMESNYPEPRFIKK